MNYRYRCHSLKPHGRPFTLRLYQVSVIEIIPNKLNWSIQKPDNHKKNPRAAKVPVEQNRLNRWSVRSAWRRWSIPVVHSHLCIHHVSRFHVTGSNPHPRDWVHKWTCWVIVMNVWDYAIHLMSTLWRMSYLEFKDLAPWGISELKSPPLFRSLNLFWMSVDALNYCHSNPTEFISKFHFFEGERKEQHALVRRKLIS